MADNLPASLQTGFDPSIDYAFKSDTQNRLSSIFSSGPVPTIDQQLPKYTVNDLLTGKFKENNDFDLKSAYFSNDPNQRQLAQQAVNKSLQNDVEYQLGINIPDIYAYDTSQDKYLTKDFGYRAEEGVALNEDFYYRNRGNGFMGSTAKFLARATGGAVFKLGESIGYLGSMINPVNWNEDFFTNVSDNSFSRYLENQEQRFKDQLLPIYKSLDYNNKGLFSKMGTAEFWSNSVADGVAFMLSAAVPGVGLAKLGNVGKLGTIAKTLTGAETIGGVGAWALNTASESAVEAAGVYKSYRNKLLEDRRRGIGEFKTDEQIDDESAKMARNTFLGNLAVLALPNAFENAMIYQKLAKSGPVQTSKGIKLFDDLTAFSRTLPTSFIGRTFGSTSRLGFYGGKGIQALGVEGLWEENAQLAVQRLNDGSSDLSFLNQYMKQTYQALVGDDGEAAESIALGGIIGFFGVGATSKFRKERRKLVDDIDVNLGKVKTLNDARKNWLSLNDIYEVNKEGQIIFENGQPKINPTKVNLKGAAYNAVADSMKAIENLDDPNLKSFYSKEIFKEYVDAHIQAGTALQLLERLSSFSQRSADEILAFGFDPTTVKTNPEDLRLYAEKLIALSEQVNNVQGISPLAKDEVFRRASQNINLIDYHTPFSNDFNRLKSQIRDVENSNLGDSFAERYNFLNFQVEGLKQVNSIKSGKYYTDAITELEKEKQELESKNTDLLNNGLTATDRNYLKKTDDGFYISENQLYQTPSFDFFNSQRKLAEVKNVMDENDYWIAQLLNPDTSLRAEQQVLQTKVDALVPKAPIIAPRRSEVTPEEFDNFENTGNVTPEILDFIAGKVARGETLKPNETAISQAKSDEISTKVQEIKTRQQASLRNNQPIAENGEYKGKVAYLTPLKTIVQEVELRGLQEVSLANPYQDFTNSFLSNRLGQEIQNYKLFITPDREEWTYNKSVGFKGPLGTVLVVTDQQGSPVYFDEQYNPTTPDKGRVITYPIDSNYTSRNFKEKVSVATDKGMFIFGRLVKLGDEIQVRQAYLSIANELKSRRDQILKSGVPQEVIMTSIQANNEAPVGKTRPAQQVFGENPIITFSGENAYMEVEGRQERVDPIKIYDDKQISDELISLYNHTYRDADEANTVRNYFEIVTEFDKNKRATYVLEPNANGTQSVRLKYAGTVKSPAEFEDIIRTQTKSPTLGFSTQDSVTIPKLVDGNLVEETINNKEFLKDKFTTNLAGTPTVNGGITYRPMNSYLTFEFVDNIGKEIPESFQAQEVVDVPSEEVIPLDLTPEGIAANPNIIVYNPPVPQPDPEIIAFEELNAVERKSPEGKPTKKDANFNINVVDRNRIPYQVTVFADPDIIKYLEDSNNTLTYRAVSRQATAALLNDKMILDLRGKSPRQIMDEAPSRQIEEITGRLEPSSLIKSINALKSSFKTLFNRDVDVVIDTNEIDDIKENDPRFSSIRPRQKVLGFYQDGIIYIDPRFANQTTALHEFSHLWNDIIKENNREFYDRGLELVAETAYYRGVKEKYPELTDEEDIREEALVRAIADKGVDLENRDTNPLLNWLRGLWDYIAGILNLNLSGEQLEVITLESYTDIVAGSLLRGSEILQEPIEDVNLKVQPELDKDTLIAEVVANLDEIRGFYRMAFEADPDEALKSIAYQMNSSPSERRGAINTVGERIANIAIKLYPDEGPQQRTDIQFQKEDVVDNNQDANSETVPKKEGYKTKNLLNGARKELTDIVEKNNLFKDMQQFLPKFNEAVGSWLSDNEKVGQNKGRLYGSMSRIYSQQDVINNLLNVIGTANNLLEDLHNEFIKAIKIEDRRDRLDTAFSIYKTAQSFADVVDLVNQVNAELAKYQPSYLRTSTQIANFLNSTSFYYNAVNDGYLKTLKPDLAAEISEKSDYYAAYKEQKDKLLEEKKILEDKLKKASARDKTAINRRINKVNEKLSQIPSPERVFAELNGEYEDISTLQLYTTSRADSSSALISASQAIVDEVDFKNNQKTQKLANSVSKRFNEFKKSLGIASWDINKIASKIVRQVDVITGFTEENEPITHKQDILLNEASPKFYSDRNLLTQRINSSREKLRTSESLEDKKKFRRELEESEIAYNDFLEKYTDTNLPSAYFEIQRLLKEEVADGQSLDEYTKSIFNRLQNLSKNIESTSFKDSIGQDAYAAAYAYKQLEEYLSGLNQPQDSIEYKMAERLQRVIQLRDSIGSFDLTDRAKEAYENHRDYRIKAWSEDKLEDDKFFKWFQYNSKVQDADFENSYITEYERIDAREGTNLADLFMQKKDILDTIRDINGVYDGNKLSSQDKARLEDISREFESQRRRVTNSSDLEVVEGYTADVNSIYYEDTLNTKINELAEELRGDVESDEAAKRLARERIATTEWYKENHRNGRPTDEWRLQFNGNGQFNFDAGENYKTYKLFPQYLVEGRKGPDGKPFINSDSSNPYRDKEFEDLKQDKGWFDFLNWYTDSYIELQENYHEKHRNGYMLPSVRKPSGERLQNFTANPVKTINRWIGDIKLNEQEREQIYGTGERIPVRFSTKIDTKDQSKDLIGSLLMYGHFANRYTELKSVEPLLVGAKDMVEGVSSKSQVAGRKGVWGVLTGAYQYIKGKNEATQLQDKEGLSNTAKGMGILVKEALYGNFDDEFALPVLGDANEIVRNILGVASKGTFFGNIVSPIKNALGGVVQELIFANIKNGAYSYTDLAKSKYDFTRYQTDFASDFMQGKFGEKSLIGQIFDRLELLQGEIQDEFGKKTQWHLAKYGHNWLTIFKNYAEFEIQATQALAFLNSKKVKQGDKMISLVDAYEKDSEGNIQLKAGVEFNQESEFAFSQLVQKYQRDMNGAYRTSERNALERTAGGKLLFYMNKYFVPMFNARFRPNYYNTQLGDFQEGFHLTTGKFLFDTIVSYKGNAMRNWKDLSETERESVWKTSKELAFIVGLGLMASSLGMGDADKRKQNSDMENYALGLLIGTYAEARSFIWPSDLYNKINNPFFAMRPIGTLIRLLADTGNTLIGSEDAYFKKDSTYWDKGDSKALADALRLLGFTGTQLDAEKFAANTELALKLRE